MRRLAAVAIVLLFAPFPTFALADTVTDLTYVGTLLASGSTITGSYYGTPTQYKNVPAAASVSLVETDSEFYGLSFRVASFVVVLPDGEISSGDFPNLYFDYDNCAYDQSGCYENIRFDFDEEEYYNQGYKLPTPDLDVSGGRNLVVNSETGMYFSDDIGFDGELQLVTTPEPSSIALLGTGLLGVAGVLQKRFTHQKRSV